MANITDISPFAPATPADLPEISGVSFTSVEAGIKYKGRKDLLLVAFTPGTVAAGVLTKSKTCSAPVLWCRRQLVHGNARGLVVNAGNANAFTGQKGEAAARLTADGAAAALGCQPDEIYLASTGVIGEPLDAGTFAGLLQSMAGNLASAPWSDAAATIMTTDTFAKVAGARLDLDGAPIKIAGIAKGSGMIAPDMATMLSFVFTDAAIAQPLLQETISELANVTFNCVTVDSDTSTSDTLLAFATRQATGAPIESRDDPRYSKFRDGLHGVLEDLAIQVAKDGEGISKFVTVEVAGAEDDAAAKRIALAIANSPLVKTAIAGQDANWGRVVMAVGKAGEAADRDKLAIWFGTHVVASGGERDASYDEATLADYMKCAEILIRTDVGTGGDGRARVWTCDLTHGYISINADYRS